MFAVVDVETTGLRPGGPDRIVEVAVVRLHANLNVRDEWATLIDPGRPVRGARVHGIFTGDVRGAPTFSEVAGDLGERLARQHPGGPQRAHKDLRAFAELLGVRP